MQQSSDSSTSSNGNSFAITTNKNIYDANDRIIVAGTVDRRSSQHFVSVKIIKDNDICVQQSVRVERDGSFISRPIRADCGPGDYLVMGSYAGESANANFTILDENTMQSKEVAQLQKALAQARDKVNGRIKELASIDVPIPEQAIEKYRMGIAESLLAIRAAEEEDKESAHQHLNSALEFFGESMDFMSPERMSTLSSVASSASNNDDRIAAAKDRLGRLTDIYHTLESLAEKNGVTDSIFSDLQLLLAEAKRLIGLQDMDSAESTLAVTESVMDKARDKLIRHASEESSDNDGSNGNQDNKTTATTAKDNSKDNRIGKGLTASAERIEKRAEKILHSIAKEDQNSRDKVKEAIGLISNAQSAIDDGNYQTTRSLLSVASKILIKLAETEQGNN